MQEATLRDSARFVAGDPLRAVAALSVLLFHAALVGIPGYDEAAFDGLYGGRAGLLLRHAGSGLFIFFVLSGYLIGRPFVRRFINGQPLPALDRYARNRLLRIVPGFWFVLTVTLLVAGPGRQPLGDVLVVYGFAQSLHETPTSSLIIQGWTLGVELSFYLLVPVAAAVAALALRAVPSGPARRAIVVALALAGGVATAQVAPDGPFYRTIVTFLWAFVPGIVLAAVEPAEGWSPGPALRRLAPPAALVLLLAGVYLVYRPPAFQGGVAVASGLIVAAPLLLQRVSGRVWRVVRWRWVQWLGERSYGIYLIHWGVLRLLQPHVHPGSNERLRLLALLAVATPVTVGLAALLFRFVEQPCLRLRRPVRVPALEAG